MSRHPSILNIAANAETNTLEYLVERGSCISNESKTLAFVDSIKSSFYDFVSRLTGFVNGLKIGNFQQRQLKADDVIKLLEGKSFQDTRNLYVVVPTGFKGSWFDYLTFMHEVVMPEVADQDKTLKLVIQRLATILTEPDRLKAQSGIRELEKGITIIPETKLTKLKSYVNNNSRTQQRFGEVFQRNADVAESYKLINSLNSDLGRVDFTSVQGSLTRLAELTKALQDLLAEEETRELSGLVTSQLSELFFKLGISLTAGAVLMDSATQMTEAMDATLTSLREQLQ